MALYRPITARSLSTLARSLPERLAELAWQALLAEAELTPKPGLVDRRGQGAHHDLTLDLMQRSASAIAPYFTKMAFASADAVIDQQLRMKVGETGREAEAAMLRTTSGSNTHKGAIWIVGLLVCAASQSAETDPGKIAAAAGTLARLPDRARPQIVSHGDIVRGRYGVTGARGEAYANFPHATDIGLPALRRARVEGRSETNSRLVALLKIMSCLDDTCILYRGDHEAQRMIQMRSSQVLEAGGPGTPAGDAALLALDRECLAGRLSPGGSADLLAATLFLDAVERRRDEIEIDSRSGEEMYGAD